MATFLPNWINSNAIKTKKLQSLVIQQPINITLMRKYKFPVCFSSILLMAGFVLSSCNRQSGQSPYSPQDALSTFQLPDGYKIELVASEPLISDPVEIAFDEDGRMYVVQMDDYPSEKMDDYAAGYEPQSKIMMLEDKDGDGFYESGSVFAEGLHYANGVMPWKGGVLVTSAPDILFLKDTNGDGKADEKKVVLTGFAVTNPQLRMSSLRYGLDNWIYAAYSRAGGGKWREEFRGKGSPLHFPDKPDLQLPELLPGTNIRFSPDTYKAETSGGMSQFGLSFDAKGNQFTVWNNVHIRNVVINDKYLSGNPFYNTDAVMADISDHGNAATVYSITKDMLNIHESEMGHFTSACGNCVYTGRIFKGKYAAADFVCEPVSNLVHADILIPDAPTFKAERGETEKEFLASTDSWFRPVNLTVGPDGGLYVVDFYRKLVEHPDWLAMADSSGFYTHAGKIKESDFLEGNDKGRIYRIVPKDYKPSKQKAVQLSKAEIPTLVGYLDHPNLWWRINAQRLLVDRKDEQAVPLIKSRLSKNISAEGKIHALWTLQGLDELPDSVVINAFQDSDPVVRKQAVLLAENRLGNKEILEKVIRASSDPDPYVQFQVALTLSTVANSSPEIFEAQDRILSAHIHNKWFRDAILLGSSANGLKWYDRFKTFRGNNDSGDVGKKEFLSKIASVIGAKYKADEISALLKMLSTLSDTGVLVSSLHGLSEGMKRNQDEIKLNPEGQQQLVALLQNQLPKVRAAAIKLATPTQLNASSALSDIIENSKRIATDTQQQPEERVLAIQTIGLTPHKLPYQLLESLLQANQLSEIQFAVANVLLNDKQKTSTALLLSKWNLFNLKIHDAVESGFLERKDRLLSLLDAIESGDIKPEWITRNTQNRILKSSDSMISNRAKGLFGNMEGGNREKIIHDYNVSTTGNGDPSKGKIVFKTNCSVCHSLEGVGVNFGPDLHSVSHQTKINLLTMILDPNHDITAGFEGYTIETTQGETFVGIIEIENAQNLALKSQGGVVHTILRNNIRSMAPMPVSLMPEGLETSVSKEEMADLIEYIKTLR